MNKNKTEKQKMVSYLDRILNKKTRPSYIQEIGNSEMFYKPNGKTSYVYLYTEIEDGLKYGGIKSVDTDKKAIETYKTSSNSKKFQKDIANKKFKLEILFWGSFKECLYVENKLLTENDAANSDLWYNKWNGQKGTPPQNRERRNDIVHDLNILRNVSVIDVKDWKSNPKKYNERLKIATVDWFGEKTNWLELYENRSRIQVREGQLDDDNIYTIKDRIKHDQPGLQLPIYFLDIVWKEKHYHDIQISGNHTVYSHWDLDGEYKYRNVYPIEIPKEIHKLLSQTDIYEIGSSCNTKVAVGKPFSKEDALKMCKESYEVGNTWYDKDVDIDWRQRGLTTSNIENVINKMNEYIEEQTKNASGQVKVNYSTPEGLAIIEEVSKKYIRDGVLVESMAGTTPNSDNINKLVSDKNEEQLSLGLPLYKEVVLLLHHSSDKTKTQSGNYIDKMNYIDNLEEGKVKEHMKSLVTNIKVITHDLPRYMPDSVYKKYKNKKVT